MYLLLRIDDDFYFTYYYYFFFCIFFMTVFFPHYCKKEKIIFIPLTFIFLGILCKLNQVKIILSFVLIFMLPFFISLLEHPLYNLTIYKTLICSVCLLWHFSSPSIVVICSRLQCIQKWLCSNFYQFCLVCCRHFFQYQIA